MNSMSNEKDIVVLVSIKSPVVASYVVQALKFHGIPAYVGGCLLQDEFALSQRAMGLNCTDIQVPRSCLKEAREIIEIMKEAGKHLDEQAQEEE